MECCPWPLLKQVVDVPELKGKTSCRTGTHPELFFQVIDKDGLVVAVCGPERVEKDHEICLEQGPDVAHINQNGLMSDKKHRHLVVETTVDLAQVSRV